VETTARVPPGHGPESAVPIGLAAARPVAPRPGILFPSAPFSYQLDPAFSHNLVYLSHGYFFSNPEILGTPVSLFEDYQFLRTCQPVYPHELLGMF